MKSKILTKGAGIPKKITTQVKNPQKIAYEKRSLKADARSDMPKHPGDRDRRKLSKETHL